MESGPLSKPEFKKFASKVVLFCHITTRIKGRKDDGLLSEKGGGGFPYLVYLNADGDVVGKPKGRDVAAFEKGAGIAQRYQDLKSKPTRTPPEELELTKLEIEMGKLDLAGAKARRKELDLPSELDAELGKVIRSLEVDKEIMGKVKSIKSRAEAQTKGAQFGEEFWAWYQKGDRPNDQQSFFYFYYFMLEYGFKKEKVAPIEIALTQLKKKFDNPRAKKFFAQQEKKLVELKSKLGGGGSR